MGFFHHLHSSDDGFLYGNLTSKTRQEQAQRQAHSDVWTHDRHTSSVPHATGNSTPETQHALRTEHHAPNVHSKGFCIICSDRLGRTSVSIMNTLSLEQQPADLLKSLHFTEVNKIGLTRGKSYKRGDHTTAQREIHASLDAAKATESKVVTGPVVNVSTTNAFNSTFNANYDLEFWPDVPNNTRKHSVSKSENRYFSPQPCWIVSQCLNIWSSAVRLIFLDQSHIVWAAATQSKHALPYIHAQYNISIKFMGRIKPLYSLKVSHKRFKVKIIDGGCAVARRGLKDVDSSSLQCKHAG